MRIYIDFDQRNLVKLLPITEFAINNKNAASTGVNPFFFFHRYHAKILKTYGAELTQPAEGHVRNFIQKADGIFTKLKQTSDWVQTATAVA